MSKPKRKKSRRPIKKSSTASELANKSILEAGPKEMPQTPKANLSDLKSEESEKPKKSLLLWMKRHNKFFEAVGLILTLGALYMDWAGVQKWTKENAKLQTSFNFIYANFVHRHLSGLIDFEAAITQYRINPDNNADSSTGHWDSSPKVRAAWMRRIESQREFINNILTQLDQFKDNYDLSQSETKTKLREDFEKASKELDSKLDPDWKNKLGLSIPNEKLFSDIEATNKGQEFSLLAQRAHRLLTSISQTFSIYSDQYSVLYRIIIIIGLTMTFIGKFMDWLVTKKTVNAL